MQVPPSALAPKGSRVPAINATRLSGSLADKFLPKAPSSSKIMHIDSYPNLIIVLTSTQLIINIVSNTMKYVYIKSPSNRPL